MKLRKISFLWLVATLLSFSQAKVYGDASKLSYSNANPALLAKGTDLKPPQFHETLKTILIPSLHTTMMFAGDSLVSAQSDAVFIFYGGTGARSESFGIVPSMKPLAEKVLKFVKEQFRLKADPVAFENPLYYEGYESTEERTANAERFGDARAQVDWMVKTLELVVSAIPKDENGRVTKKIWLGTRSTGSGVFAQMLHEYYTGRPGTEVVGQIDGAILMGLVGHRESEIDDWHKEEEEFFSKSENKELIDTFAQPYGVKIFRGMTWAPEGAVPYLKAPSSQFLPKVLITLGSNDHSSTIEQQLSVAENLSVLHPELSVVALGMDTEHNPGAPLEYTNRSGKIVKVERMKRLSPILEGVAAYISQIPDRELKVVSKKVANLLKENSPGLKSLAMEQTFDGPSLSDCKEAMTRFGTIIPR